METHDSTLVVEQIFWPYLRNPIFMKNTHGIETNVISKLGPTDCKVTEVPVKWQVFLPHLWCVSFCGHMIIGLTNKPNVWTAAKAKASQFLHMRRLEHKARNEEIRVKTRVYHLPLWDADDVISFRSILLDKPHECKLSELINSAFLLF